MSIDEKSTRKHNHYYIDVSIYKLVDIYRIVHLYGVTSHCIGQAIKKLMLSGRRGAKGYTQDLQEAIDLINRQIEMIREDESA